MALVLGVTGVGCGDRCQALCQQVAERVGDCRPSSITWVDLGATSRADFVDSCRDQWDRVRLDLSGNDLRLALEDCADANQEVDTVSCDEVIALYGPAAR